MIGGDKLDVSQYFFMAVFWYACWFLDAIPYWRSLLGGVEEQSVTPMGEDDSGDSFINAAMFQDME